MVYIESIAPTAAADVLRYVPNLIGYLRVICTLASLFLMMAYPHLWLIATLLYVASFVGDLFGMSSLFGLADTFSLQSVS
jgi:phosphatidylglycerophosphate synthase